MDGRFFRWILIIFLGYQGIIYGAAPSAPPKAPLLSLDDAVLLALRYNPTIQNAEIQRIVDKFNLRLAKYSYELQYALTGNFQYNNSTSNGVNGEGNKFTLSPQVSYLSPIGTQVVAGVTNVWSHVGGQSHYSNPQATLNITQPLLQGFGTTVTMAPLYNAYDQELINRLSLQNVAITTITQVVSKYTALVQAINTLKSLELSLATSQKTVKQYQIKLKVGQVAPADIIQFETDVSSKQQSIEAQKITIKQARFALLETLGLDHKTPFTVTDRVGLDDTKLPTLEQSIELALKNDINYQTQKINYRIAQRQFKVTLDKLRWTLNANVVQSVGGGTGGPPNSGVDSLFNGQNKNLSAGLQLNVPINDVPAKAAVVQAKVGLKQSETLLDAQKRQVIDTARTAYYTLMSQKRQITQAQTTLELSNRNLKNAYIRLDVGRATPFEVSSLQSSLTLAEINLISSEISYINALAAFEQIVGTTLDRWNVQIRY